jgi:hypothetical protein
MRTLRAERVKTTLTAVPGTPMRSRTPAISLLPKERGAGEVGLRTGRLFWGFVLTVGFLQDSRVELGHRAPKLGGYSGPSRPARATLVS